MAQTELVAAIAELKLSIKSEFAVVTVAQQGKPCGSESF
jgi:hypothetical protein